MGLYENQCRMKEEESRNEVWIEDFPMSPEAEQMTEIIRRMDIRGRSMAVLDLLAHDADVQQVVRGRMNWELREIIRDAVIEEQKNMPNADLTMIFHKIFSEAISKECETIMLAVFPEDYEEEMKGKPSFA